MGYACPVCDQPQRDATHLANHLAFTAMVDGGGEDHAAWLDANVPEWGEMGPAELGPRVADLAPDAAYDEVFEDTVSGRVPDGNAAFDDGHGHGHGHDHDHDHAHPPAGGVDASGETLDADAERILEEARSLTRELLDDEGERATDGDDGDGKES